MRDERNSCLLPTKKTKKKNNYMKEVECTGTRIVLDWIGLRVWGEKMQDFMRDFCAGTSMFSKPESKNLDIKQTWKCHSQNCANQFRRIGKKKRKWRKKKKTRSILWYSWFRTLRQSLNALRMKKLKRNSFNIANCISGKIIIHAIDSPLYRFSIE